MDSVSIAVADKYSVLTLFAVSKGRKQRAAYYAERTSVLVDMAEQCLRTMLSDDLVGCVSCDPFCGFVPEKDSAFRIYKVDAERRLFMILRYNSSVSILVLLYIVYTVYKYTSIYLLCQEIVL